MKAISKKVPQIIGFTSTMEDFLEHVQNCDLEFYMDNDEMWTLTGNDDAVIKVKGKAVDIKDIKIEFRESENE